MKKESNYPHLYSCSVCEKAVTVKPQGEGIEPVIIRKCGHDNAIVYANRKVTLRGKSAMTVMNKVTLTIRQFLSLVLKRSV